MGDHYTTDSYRRAIQRACDKAIPGHRWHPHQLRHTALTEIEREKGIEHARAVAGHKTIQMTDHYVEQDQRRAIEALRGRSVA